ncbi:MAG: endopeptidase La [Candidatus Onthovivens sp.]|nr:endopeptidase La [Mollicutes bacterium]MDY4857496.1 endopeptidase La [Candidatus Onthovivens sp.]
MITINPGEIVRLPVLVCKGFVIFPEATSTIYAERNFSKTATKISLDKFEGYVVVVTQKSESKVSDFSYEDISSTGTLCRISSSSGNTTLKLRLIGLERIKIESLEYNDIDKTYYANVSLFSDILGDERKEEKLVQTILDKIEKQSGLYFNNSDGYKLISQLSSGVNALKLSYALSQLLAFPTKIKLELLEAKDVNDRLQLILNNLDYISQDLLIEQEIQNELQKSASKNQREYILREKMRIIKEELNDDPELTDQENINKKLEEGNYPPNIKQKIKEEIKRFNMMPQASLEASLIKNYIDIMFSIPWDEKTVDNDDLNNVQHILDEDHYGLDKVKKRIIEYLAVKQKTGNLKAPILCFYGPPGVGKTSLGRSIARALGRKFVKSSLGGVSDEAEIRGHRRTYVGSMPGRIIQGMRKAKTTNPVFLLDEIDKIGSSYKGDPSSALLEVLDPEQNFAFNDNYIEEPYDLSNVLFICTANYLGNIPEPLRDRLELIEVNSYTLIDKMHIAKEHLIKKEMDANGLKESDIQFEDDALAYIIERYTREAGVRELERKISSICRRVVVNLVSKKRKTKEIITIKKVKEYLGTEIFDSTAKEKGAQVGVVTGLAYTEFGGDILPIEVNNFPGKGNLVLTGKLGDVMKESCSIAYDYIKANAKKYGIDDEVFAKNDLHIHFPEGAVPKDGPSAGCAITVAIISCLTNHPVSGDIAMTGEVTLRGKALAIGGLREKSLAALRSGIKKIIIPSENKKHVSELPKEVKDNLEIIYMDSVDKAIEICLK